MALDELLALADKGSKKVPKSIATEENLEKNLETYRDIVSYWRTYPDKFVDYLVSLDPSCKFKFYFVQRMTLRIFMRYKTVFATFSRGFSKSFMAVMALMLKCILYPGSKIATTSAGKNQSAAILTSKMQEICQLIPPLANEIEWENRTGAMRTSQTRDIVHYVFKNGSVLSNVGMTESARGLRYQSLLVEECAKIDQDKLTEIILPMLVVSRKVNGKEDPNEPLNQSAIFVTSAGYKDSYSYEKLINTICEMVLDPKKAFAFGGTYRIPVKEGLQPANFIHSQESDASMDTESFNREYNSMWSGKIQGAFFDLEQFDRARKRKVAAKEWFSVQEGFFVLGIDVGRIGCTTEIAVVLVKKCKGSHIDRVDGDNVKPYTKSVVNLFTLEEDHFGLQAIKIKRLFYKYKCRAISIDGNGLGIGLIDFLSQETFDPDTGATYPGFGTIGEKGGIPGHSFEPGVLKVIKAHSKENSDLYSYLRFEMQQGHMEFLCDEKAAKNFFCNPHNPFGIKFNNLAPVEREEILHPYVQTSMLRTQLGNLVTTDQNPGLVTLKQATRAIPKDKVSALIYALAYIKEFEMERKYRRAKHNIKDYMLFTKH